VDAKPKAPNHHHQGNQILPLRVTITEYPVEQGERGKPQSPGNIDDPCIPDTGSNAPDPSKKAAIHSSHS